MLPGRLGMVSGVTGGVKSLSDGSPTAVASNATSSTPFLVDEILNKNPEFLSTQIVAESLGHSRSCRWRP